MYMHAQVEVVLFRQGDCDTAGQTMRKASLSNLL